MGDVDFFSLLDRSSEFTREIFIGTNSRLLERLAPQNRIAASINAFVIRSGETTVLVDTGMGFGVLDHLKAAGIRPEQINAVLLTHSHQDHVQGLLAGQENRATFPNATLWIAPAEMEFWKSANATWFEKCRQAYRNWKMIPNDKTAPIVLPQITAIAAPGHTPGHTVFLVSTKDERLLLAGDLLHGVPLQFLDPEVNARFDVDQKMAAKTRRQILSRVAANGWTFAGAHVPFPGGGKVTSEGSGFRFTAWEE